MPACQTPRIRSLTALIPVLSLMSATASQAQPIDVNVSLRLDMGADTNPFLTPKGTVLPASSADTAGSTRFAQQTVEGALGIPLGSDQTRCVFTGRVSALQYRPIDLLDHKTGQAQAHCPWQWTSLWAGELQARQTREPTPFWDGSARRLDMRDERLLRSVIMLRPSPDNDLPFSLQSRRIRHQDRSGNGQFDVDETRAGLAWVWHPPTNSVLKLDADWLQSSYPNRTDTQALLLDKRWQELRAGVDLQWRYSASTSLGGRVGLVRRQYSELSQRDFSTAEGSLNFSYRPSPAHQISVQAARNTQDSYQADSLYTIARSQNVSWTWQATPQTRMQSTYAHEIDAAAGAQGGSASDSTQRARRFNLKVFHDLGSGLGLHLGYQRRHDTHSDLTGDIVDQLWQVGLSYNFENLAGARERSGLGNNF